MLGHAEALFRETLAVVLAHEADLSVVAQAGDVGELFTQAQRFKPDVAVIDIGVSSHAQIRQLCQNLRESAPNCRPLIIVDRWQRANAGRALALLAPLAGLMAADASPAELVDAVRQLAEGKVVLDPRLAVAALAADYDNPLTDREREVLELAVSGLLTKQIARHLHLSSGTVRNCLSKVRAKTGARTRIEAIRVAREAGWI